MKHLTILKSKSVRALTAALLVSSALPVAAQDRVIAFEAGIGPRYAPLYEGSSDYRWTPAVTGGVSTISLGRIQVQRGDGGGFAFGPSFRYIAEREAAEAPELAGIPDRDWAVEVGGKALYAWDNAEAFAAVRQGFHGHTGVVGDFGANVVMRPTDDTTIKVGPRLSVASGSYMDTYFSVPTTATTLAPFDAGGGLRSAGLELSVRQDLSDTWSVEGTAGWNRLIGDAGASPIVAAGDRDQFGVSVTLVRQFNWQF